MEQLPRPNAGNPSGSEIDVTPVLLIPDSNEDLSNELTRLAGHINAAQYRFLKLLAELILRDGWAGAGIKSAAHWLNYYCGIDLGAAREKVRVAKSLAALPKIDAAFRTGAISYSKVRAMTRSATPDNEEMLLQVAEHGTAQHVEQLVRKYRRTSRLVEAKQACHQYASRELNWFYDDDGMLVLRGRLTPEDGAIFLKVMDAMFAATDAADLGSDHGIEGSRDDEFASLSEKTFPQKRADMFALMAEQVLSGLDQGLRALAPADKYQVVINIEGRHQCNGEHQLHGSLESDDTTLPLPASVLRRICCDASLVAVVEDGDGNVLNVGRKTRAIPPAIRRALKKRDHGCRFPGCCETKFVDAHHIVHWSEGGETKLDNLILLCRHHHRLLHQEAYEIVQDTSASELTSDSASATTSRSASAREAAASSRPSAGGFVFMSPSGQRMPHSLSPQFVSAEDAEVTETLTIEREHAVLGLQIDESTAVTHWQGERLDFDFAVDVMLSSARQAPPPGPYQAL